MKLKEETKPIKDTCNNQSKASTIFNELINKRKDSIKKSYDNVDYENLHFEYVGPTEDVSFYKYKNSKELFNAIKDNQINFNDAVKRQNEILNKISNIKIGKKTTEEREVIDNVEKYYISREEVIETMEKWFLMHLINQNKMKQSEKDLKY